MKKSSNKYTDKAMEDHFSVSVYHLPVVRVSVKYCTMTWISFEYFLFFIFTIKFLKILPNTSFFSHHLHPKPPHPSSEGPLPYFTYRGSVQYNPPTPHTNKPLGVSLVFKLESRHTWSSLICKKRGMRKFTGLLKCFCTVFIFMSLYKNETTFFSFYVYPRREI